MFKKIIVFGFLIVFVSLFAQKTVNGKMNPAKKYTWFILYKLDGVSQKFVTNGAVNNGVFTLTMPKDATVGMYRILYDNANNKFIDFIYNNEDVDVEFHPEYPTSLIKFSKSKENMVYNDYLNEVGVIHNKLDSIQVVYFKSKDNKQDKFLSKIYSKELENLTKTQTLFESSSTSLMANNFVVANKRFYSNNLIKSPTDYLATIKDHYFDNLDFDNPILIKSSFVIDRIMDYVFYLNTSESKELEYKLRQESIDNVMSKIKKDAFKKQVVESFLYTFAQKEDLVMVDYMFKNHFDKLPISLQDYEFKSLVLDMIKTTIGVKAPNIVWKEKGEEKSLYSLKEHKYYVVVFWSSTCPHCLKEMPELQKYLSDKKDVKVLAIGLETKESKIGWVDEKFYYEDFTHILGENKFDNKYVKDYGVNSTPNFFILNSDKTIIAKPYDVKALKEVYPKLPK